MTHQEEIEFELVSARPDPSDQGGPSSGGTKARWIPLIVAVSVVGGFVVGTLNNLAVGSDRSVDATVDIVEEPVSTALSSSTTVVSTIQQSTRSSDASPFPAILVMPESETSTDRFALTPRARATNLSAPVWIVDSGRTTARSGLNLRSGNDRYPILFAGDDPLFMGLSEPLRLLADASSVEPLELPDEVSYLVAGATPDLVWAVHGEVARPNAVTILRSGEPEATLSVDGLRWISAGVGDGLVGLESGLSSAAGVVAYWTPAGGSRRLESLADDHSAILAGSGDLVAVFETGPKVVIVDVRNDVRVAETGFSHHPNHACFSPGGTFLALTQGPPDGSVIFFEIGDPTRVNSFATGPIHDMTWASDERFLASVGDAVLSVDLLELPGRARDRRMPTAYVGTPIVELSGADGWWIASDASNC